MIPLQIFGLVWVLDSIYTRWRFGKKTKTNLLPGQSLHQHTDVDCFVLCRLIDIQLQIVFLPVQPSLHTLYIYIYRCRLFSVCLGPGQGIHAAADVFWRPGISRTPCRACGTHPHFGSLRPQRWTPLSGWMWVPVEFRFQDECEYLLNSAFRMNVSTCWIPLSGWMWVPVEFHFQGECEYPLNSTFRVNVSTCWIPFSGWMWVPFEFCSATLGQQLSMVFFFVFLSLTFLSGFCCLSFVLSSHGKARCVRVELPGLMHF